MVRIGVIEDDSNMRRTTKEIISKVIQGYEDIECKEFESAEAFQLEKEEYDIILLDIDLPGMNGVELGKKILRESKDTVLIYLTSYTEYAWESYLIEAYQYILKSNMEERLPLILRKAVGEKVKEKKDYRIFGNSYKKIKLYYKDILYIQKEKEKKYTEYVTKSGTYRERIPFGQILKEIDDARFVPIDRGHAINIQYIDQIDDCIIYMETEEEFKVSRVQLKTVKKHIAKYWRDFA